MACRALALICGLLGSAALADFDPDAYPRHETCALCHGLFGTSHSAKFPHLAGQDPLYLERQLQAFVAGSRSNDGGQMAAIVTELQPGDIERVVTWFTEQEPPAPAAVGDSRAGAVLYSNMGCGACHDAASRPPGVPHLTAQHAGYLGKQIRDFLSGKRRAPADIDHQTILPSTPEDIDALSLYLSGQAR